MKKLFVALTVTLLTGITAMGQSSIFHNPNNKAYFGIRINPEVTCPGNLNSTYDKYNVTVDAFKNGSGVEFGGIYNIPVVANFYIEPGLKLYYNTYSLNDGLIDHFEDDIILNGMSVKKFGMRIPVMAGYHFDFTNDIKVYLFTGPELEIGFTAKEYFKGYNIEMSNSVYGDEGGYRRIDLLWGIGAGVSYQHIYFGISGGIGMLNMLSDSNEKFRENRVTFSLGYNF